MRWSKEFHVASNETIKPGCSFRCRRGWLIDQLTAKSLVGSQVSGEAAKCQATLYCTGPLNPDQKWYQRNLCGAEVELKFYDEGLNLLDQCEYSGQPTEAMASQPLAEQ